MIFTYKEKDELESISRIKRAIFVVFLFLIAVCTGVFLWQGHASEKKMAEITGLEQKLTKLNPPLNKDFILQWSVKTKNQFDVLKAYSRKYLAIAAIGELSKITPSDIRLVNLTAELGPCPDTKEKADSKALIIEGIIFGAPDELEGSLAAYLMKLENSPLFSAITVHNTKIEDFENKEVLHFWTRLNLV